MTKKKLWLIASAVILTMLTVVGAHAGSTYSCQDGSTCPNSASCEGDAAYYSGCKVQCLVASGRAGVYYLGGSSNCAASNGNDPFVRSPEG